MKKIGAILLQYQVFKHIICFGIHKICHVAPNNITFYPYKCYIYKNNKINVNVKHIGLLYLWNAMFIKQENLDAIK